MKAILGFEDGDFVVGEGFGAEGTFGGELVFSTQMTGYMEALTDPSYHGLKIFEALGPMKMAYILKARVQGLRDLGSCMSPFNAFQFIQGLETLPLRMRATHCSRRSRVRWQRAAYSLARERASRSGEARSN